jgi:MinD superfamily P-loop ATPase
MSELVVISGKGGTGKTSVVASLAALYAGRVVVADCDVDAADLHLVLNPAVEHRAPFIGGSKARIQSDHCTACGKCEQLCRFQAITFDGPGNGRVPRTFRVDSIACEGCGVCAWFCEHDAVAFAPAVCGTWFVSRTRNGPLVHARLKAGGENSGKLVTLIRQQAQRLARQRELEWILCDGSPGIGCPVIASLTGADAALIVVEPTVSGLHDFRRVGQLTCQLNVPGLLVVNKADLNLRNADALEGAARQLDIPPVGRIPYDAEVTRSQIAGRAVVEASQGSAAKAIREIGSRLEEMLPGTASAAGQLVQLQTATTNDFGGDGISANGGQSR